MQQEGMGQALQGQVQSAGYGPTRSGRPVEMVPYDHSAMGDHTRGSPQVPSVTVQQTQMQIRVMDIF